MNIRVLTLCLAFSAPCSALELNLYGLSYHPGSDRGHNDDEPYNEFNIGVGVQHDFRETARGAWMGHAGIFLDSDRNWAKMLGGGYQWKVFKRVRAGILLTAVQSRSYSKGALIFVPIPLVSFDFGRVKLHVSGLPRPRGRSVAAAYISILY